MDLDIWDAVMSFADDAGHCNIQEPAGTMVRVLLPLQRWLERHGSRLLQLQISRSFSTKVGAVGLVGHQLLFQWFTSLVFEMYALIAHCILVQAT